MGGDVRTTVGVPKLSAFANGTGTPLVIDTATGVGYFTDKNTVVPITGGGASGVTSVNGETGVVVLDAADVGAVAKTGDTGSALIPAGTDAQRDPLPAVGAIRFSSTSTGWEGWNGTNWVSIGGGQMPQTWQDVTASRSLGTVYTNNTGQPIDVSTNCSVTVGNGSSNFAVGSYIVSSGFATLNVSSAITYARVPAGATYRLDNAFGTVAIFKWMELRA